MEGPYNLPSTINDSADGDDNEIKCKICNVEFTDDEALGIHWLENHKQESHCSFTGYACALCLDSFTNKEMLVKHVTERHGIKFVEHCLIHQCIPCGSHLGNLEELWLHVLSAHRDEFKQLKAPKRLTLPTDEDPLDKSDHGKEANKSEKKPTGSGKFTCKICGLKFNSLPDIGRHHKAAHKERNQDGRPSGKNTADDQRPKSGRVSRPSSKKVAAETSNKSKSKANANSKRRVRKMKSPEVEEPAIQPNVNETNIVEVEENQNLADPMIDEPVAL